MPVFKGALELKQTIIGKHFIKIQEEYLLWNDCYPVVNHETLIIEDILHTEDDLYGYNGVYIDCETGKIKIDTRVYPLAIIKCKGKGNMA